jgi:V-type H+-transporting ATPase subunit a
VPNYKEVNPAYFATVTFPFLFAVMFGDVGHGFLLFSLASVNCLIGHILVKKYKGLQSAYKIRYMLLMMGFFSTFCGLLYNDFMGIPLNLFGSCYNLSTGIRKDPNCVYPLGFDPVWALSKQDLIVTNSIKMKTAVIIGVAHMLLGLV